MTIWTILWGLWALIVLSELRTIIRNQEILNEKLRGLHRTVKGDG